MKHSKKNELRITIPIHSGDLPKPVLRSILKQAQLTIEEFNTFR
jgi:predicted RNA binding protein YcfA (HicA-like mRNA interferase family)